MSWLRSACDRAARSARGWLRLQLRPEPWLMGCALVAAAAATVWFSEQSLPARHDVAWVVGQGLDSWTEFFRLIVNGADSQPHAVWWLALTAGLALTWHARSRFAPGGALAAVVTIFPVPLFKQFIWSNTTVEFRDILVDGAWLRFWPLALPLPLFAVHVMLADHPLRGDLSRIGAAQLGPRALLRRGAAQHAHGVHLEFRSEGRGA